jgi:hypothetical protein
LSWDAIAPADDGLVTNVDAQDSALPTWTTMSPRTTSSSRVAAVTMHRSGSPLSVGSPVVSKSLEEHYRGREFMLRKQAASKARWR